MAQSSSLVTHLNKITESAQKLPQLKPRPVHTPPKRPRKQLNEVSWEAFRNEYSRLA